MNIQNIERHIEQYIRPDAVLGMGIEIVQGDEVIYRGGFGVTSVEDSGLPVTPGTIFSIGSTSKTINALMIMRLVEQGILDLDVPIIAYLPGFTFTSNPGWGRRITLRHLLSHTSGLVSAGKAWGPRDQEALRRWIWDEVAHFALIADPGRVAYYANGPTVAGHVAEAATGKYYPQLVEEQVFTPLGMQRSTYDRRVAMTHPLALAHSQGEDRKLFTLHLYPDNPAGNPEGFCMSTVDDLAKILIVSLNGGRFQQEQYLLPESIATMQAAHGDYLADAINDVRAAMMRYEGLGLSIGTYKGVHTVGHSGMLIGMMTMLDLFPAQGFGVVSVANYCDAEQRNEMLFHIYDQLLGTPTHYRFPPPPKLSGEAHMASWRQHTGTYVSPAGVLITIVVRNESLTLIRGDEAHVLIAVTPTQYYFEDANGQRTPVAFLSQASGLTQIVLIFPDVHTRTEVHPDFTLDANILSKYCGLYANYKEDNIIEGFYVGVRGDTLYIYPAEDYGLLIALDERRGLPCTTLSSTMFIADSGLYDFTVAPDDSVDYVTKDLALRYRRVNGVDEATEKLTHV